MARAIHELTEMERQRALRSITLITQSKTELSKEGTVADGRKQRDYIPRDDVTSPTLSTEALMLIYRSVNAITSNQRI